MVEECQRALRWPLPLAYAALLAERNGGVPVRRCFPTQVRTSWAHDHIAISCIRGIGGTWGIDSSEGLSSAAMVAEWGYPDIGIVICETPSGGHDTVMLDYRETTGDAPAVVYIDDDRTIIPIAPSFADFISGLFVCLPPDA